MTADVTWFSFWPYILLGLILLVVFLVLFAVITRRQSKTRPQTTAPEPGAGAAADEPQMTSDRTASITVSIGQLRRSFAQAHRRLKRHVAGRRPRYRVPWFLMLGATDAGKTTLLSNLGLHYPLGKPSEERPGSHPPCNWWFFDQGVVLDIAGHILGLPEGEDESKPGWQSLLRLLHAYRPKRPLDGIILTISCSELAGLHLQEKTELNRLQGKAASLYKHLWQAQDRLGMRLPVYVLVTKCDELPGFQSLCRNLPPARQQDIVGWSSPYTLEAAYMTNWVDEAFDHLNTRLFQTQIEIFTVQQEVEERDGVFQFPGAFQTLREPLRIYLDQLFTQSVYHESFFFRGLYFCGDANGGAVKTAGQGLKQPLFLRHLFERKILPEARLARPVTRKSTAAHRTMRFAQGLAALLVLAGGLGLWHATTRLAHQQPALLQALDKLQTDLHKIDSVVDRREQRKQLEILNLGYESKESIATFTNELQVHARHTLDTMNQIPARGLTSLFLPSSWVQFAPQFEFAPLNAAVSRAAARAYNHIILRAMFYRLTVDAEQLASAPRLTERQPQRTTNLNILQTHMQQLATLQDNYTKLNNFQNEENIRSLFSDPQAVEEIQELMSALFGAETLLPETLFKDPAFRQYIVSEGREWLYDPQQVASQTETVLTLAQRYYASLFYPNTVLEQLKGLLRYIWTIEAGEANVETFHNFLACIEETQTILAAPASLWITKSQFNPDDRFNEVLTAIQQSAFLGPEVSTEIQTEGEAEFQQLKTAFQELASRQASEIGPLLQMPAGEAPLQLSPVLLSLNTALKQWLRLPFMTLHRSSTSSPAPNISACMRTAPLTPGLLEEMQLTAAIPAHNQLIWDIALLKKAAQLAPEYESFRHKNLKSFPASWHQTMSNQSLDQLEAHMRTLLPQAQKFVPRPGRTGLADAIQADLKSFQEAVKPMNQILKVLDQLELVPVYWELLDVVAQHAQHLLRQVDTLLTQEALYTSRDGNFAWWTGDQGLALQAFGVTDVAGLSQYLKVQQQRVKTLATQYAKPLITFLVNHPVDLKQADAKRLTRWQNILTALKQHAKQTPGNSVTTLEQFILSLNEATPETCLPKPNHAPLALKTSDYFIQRRDYLRHGLHIRCQALTDRIVHDRYEALAVHFTRHLAGRFPFSSEQLVSAGQLGQEEVEVRPQTIRTFYQLFDTSAPAIRTILQHSDQFGAAGERVLAFLQQLEAVRAFLAPYIDGVGGVQKPVFDLQVTFRVNRRHEVNADQIIDWRLQAGDNLLRYHSAKRHPHGRWRYGEPVQLSLRWAKNAPWVPILHGSQDSVRGANYTVVYTDASNWSLLRFLRQHAGASTDFDQLVDLDPHTLSFTITTTPAAVQSATQYGTSQKPSRTKAFIRVTLLSPDKKAQLVMPVFPTRAPELPASGRQPVTVGKTQQTAGHRH